MRYWIATLKWSQTDHDKIIIQASTRDAAQAELKRRFKINGPAYIEVEINPARMIDPA